MELSTAGCDEGESAPGARNAAVLAEVVLTPVLVPWALLPLL